MSLESRQQRDRILHVLVPFGDYITSSTSANQARLGSLYSQEAAKIETCGADSLPWLVKGSRGVQTLQDLDRMMRVSSQQHVVKAAICPAAQKKLESIKETICLNSPCNIVNFRQHFRHSCPCSSSRPRMPEKLAVTSEGGLRLKKQTLTYASWCRSST